MGFVELFGMLSTVATASWFIAEKINGLDRRMDDRLDIIEDAMKQGRSEGRRMDERIRRLEQKNDSEIEKLNHLLTSCRIIPFNTEDYPS